MRLLLLFILSCLFSVVRPYQVTLHAKSKLNNTISSSVILSLLFFVYFYFFVIGVVYWLVEISTVTLPELKCEQVRRYLLGLGSVAGQTFQTIFHVAWSVPWIVCDNYHYIYNKLHIHSGKCDCFFPLAITFCNSYLVVKGVPHGDPLIKLSSCALSIIFAPYKCAFYIKLNIYCVKLSMSWRIIIIIVILIINPYVDYAEWLISQESMLVCFCFHLWHWV